MNLQKLPMRNGVGVIVLNNENKVFVGKRKDNPVDKWQMPQGGVDTGESYLLAMKRELYEETSIKSIKILKEIDGFFEYELPNNLVGILAAISVLIATINIVGGFMVTRRMLAMFQKS